MTSKKIGFIGLGLIGGSIAKAIRQYYPEYDIIAFDKNKNLWHLQYRRERSILPAHQSMIISVAALIFSYVHPSITMLPTSPS